METTDRNRYPVRSMELAPGVSVEVRRASKSVQTRFAQAANLRGADDIAGMLAVQEFMIRWGVTDAAGLAAFGSGAALPYSRESHPELGDLATLEVNDALAEIDGAIEQLADWIQNGKVAASEAAAPEAGPKEVC